ncbi:MAG TPA: hypothetical protein VEQ58_02270, partial [Polyangiaceae bacterium]|nr:hypothetical protein [Polyangiaceae bacterium]
MASANAFVACCSVLGVASAQTSTAADSATAPAAPPMTSPDTNPVQTGVAEPTATAPASSAATMPAPTIPMAQDEHRDVVEHSWPNRPMLITGLVVLGGTYGAS